MSRVRLLTTIAILVSIQYGCVTVSKDLRYYLPKSGTPTALLLNGPLMGGGRIAMIDGKEPEIGRAHV